MRSHTSPKAGRSGFSKNSKTSIPSPCSGFTPRTCLGNCSTFDMLENRLAQLLASALARIADAASPEDLECVRVDVLGRKGTLAQISKEMGKVAPEQRAPLGKLLNSVKQEIEAALEAKESQFADTSLRERLDAEWIDLTLPAPGVRPGSLHPVTQV